MKESAPRVIGRGPLASTAQRDVGTYGARPVERPLVEGSGMKSTTLVRGRCAAAHASKAHRVPWQELDAGTVKHSRHLPNYGGFIPNVRHNPVAAAQAEALKPRDSLRKVLIRSTYSHNAPGYTGHAPAAAHIDRGPVKVGRVRSAGALRAVTCSDLGSAPAADGANHDGSNDAGGGAHVGRPSRDLRCRASGGEIGGLEGWMKWDASKTHAHTGKNMCSSALLSPPPQALREPRNALVHTLAGEPVASAVRGWGDEPDPIEAGGTPVRPQRTSRRALGREMCASQRTHVIWYGRSSIVCSSRAFMIEASDMALGRSFCEWAATAAAVSGRQQWRWQGVGEVGGRRRRPRVAAADLVGEHKDRHVAALHVFVAHQLPQLILGQRDAVRASRVDNEDDAL